MMLFIFGLAGMALAAMGTYGLVSYTVRQSTREIGIRMALGANHFTVVRGFLARGLRLGLIGAALGDGRGAVGQRPAEQRAVWRQHHRRHGLHAGAGHRPRCRRGGHDGSRVACDPDQAAQRPSTPLDRKDEMTTETSSQKPLRLWPGVMFAVAMVVLWFGAPMVVPDAELPVGLIGMMVAALGVLIWWLLFSRVPWVERIGAVLLMIVAVFVTRPLVHPSISGAGQGMLMYILPIPVFMLALVMWAAASRYLTQRPASGRAGRWRLRSRACRF